MKKNIPLQYQLVFECKLKNIHEVLLLKSILIQKKILWIINFVLIKFSLNAILFGKLRNEHYVGPWYNENAVLAFYTRSL